MKILKKIVLIMTFFLGVLLYPYIKVEILTYMYVEEFVNLQENNMWLADYRYIKVFDYNDKIARIYYSASSSRDFVIYIKDNNNWQEYSWETIWSLSGSADDYIWPFYP